MKKLYRSRKRKMISGICGGLGNYFRIDPTFIRAAFLCLCLFSAVFPLLIGYLIATIIIPLEPKDMHHPTYKRLYRSRTDRKIAGILGGLAHLFTVDATILRVAYVILCFVTGIAPLVVIYCIGWILIPKFPDSRTIDVDVSKNEP